MKNVGTLLIDNRSLFMNAPSAKEHDDATTKTDVFTRVSSQCSDCGPKRRRHWPSTSARLRPFVSRSHFMGSFYHEYDKSF